MCRGNAETHDALIVRLRLRLRCSTYQCILQKHTADDQVSTRKNNEELAIKESNLCNLARVDRITSELAVLTGCLDMDDDFALQAEDGSFLNYFPVNYPDGHVRKNWAIEFRQDGLYLHSSSSILNGKVTCPYKAQLCMELVRGPISRNKALRLVALLCRGNIIKTSMTIRILENAGLIKE